jgi:hypothetical protein
MFVVEETQGYEKVKENKKIWTHESLTKKGKVQELY